MKCISPYVRTMQEATLAWEVPKGSVGFVGRDNSPSCSVSSAARLSTSSNSTQLADAANLIIQCQNKMGREACRRGR